MNKLTISHLAPYLPYGLKIIFDDGEVNWLVIPDYDETDPSYCVTPGFVIKNQSIVKPILRPMSELKTFEIEVFERKHTMYNLLTGFSQQVLEGELDLDDSNKYLHISYWDFRNLLANHFDVFGLIGQGLAIDINTI